MKSAETWRLVEARIEPGQVAMVGQESGTSEIAEANAERMIGLVQEADALALRRKRLLRHKLIPGGGMVLFFLGAAILGAATVPSLTLGTLFGLMVLPNLRRYLRATSDYRELLWEIERDRA